MPIGFYSGACWVVLYPFCPLISVCQTKSPLMFLSLVFSYSGPTRAAQEWITEGPSSSWRNTNISESKRFLTTSNSLSLRKHWNRVAGNWCLCFQVGQGPCLPFKLIIWILSVKFMLLDVVLWKIPTVERSPSGVVALLYNLLSDSSGISVQCMENQQTCTLDSS